MKEYMNIAQALGCETCASDKENGVYLVEELADKLETALGAMTETQAALAQKDEEIANLNAKLAEMTADTSNAEAMAQLQEQLTAAQQTIQEHETTIAGKSDEIAQLQAAVEEKGNELETSKATIQELHTTIEAKDAEIQALSEAAPEPQVPATPAQPAEPTAKAWDDMTLEEKAAAWSHK